MEILKLALAYLIASDLDIYYEEDDRPANCRTSDLIEELGQVEFVFSDKTGTLTQNVMVFRKCSLQGKQFGSMSDEKISDFHISGDKSAAEILERNGPEAQSIHNFFTLMSVCHTVFQTEEHNSSKFPHYQAASPDELALVQASVDMGYVFEQKTQEFIKVRVRGQELIWNIKCEIPFNSDRKRMSLIVKSPDQRLLIMTKGADSIIKKLMKEGQDLQTTQEHIDQFAKEGLRTLMMGQRFLSQQEFDKWMERWNEIQLLNVDNKDDLLNEQAKLIERDLELIGASAIEDKLQEGVPDTIQKMLQANIRTWVLTGDKEETAIEIGKACNLIGSDNFTLVRLSSESQQQFQTKLYSAIEQYKIMNVPMKEIDQLNKKAVQKMGIVINGETLAWALNEELPYREPFFRLGFLSNSCICCRVSPAQKMQVVQLAKQFGKWITLSIGDGANDVSMIQEAHIGVGIAGKEGTQALRASDYAFAQFKFLGKLLLVHGKWGYRRISWFICYYFYKNVAVVFTELWFALFNGFSGQIYFLDWLPMLYNAFWTSWPCLFTFALERDVEVPESFAYPNTFEAGQRQIYFTYKRFWSFMVNSIFHGAICYWCCSWGMTQPLDESGLVNGHWFLSTLAFTMIIHRVYAEIELTCNSLFRVVYALSLLFYYLTVFVLNTSRMAEVFQPQLEFLFFYQLSYGYVWAQIIFLPIICIVPDLLVRCVLHVFYPNPVDIVMEIQQQTDLNRSNQKKTEIQKNVWFDEERQLYHRT